MQNILELFCASTGMQVNKEKFVVMINGIPKEVVAQLKDHMPFAQHMLDDGLSI
jgi:hypothetical protein